MSFFTKKLSPKEDRFLDEFNRAIGVILQENREMLGDLFKKYPEGSKNAENVKQLQKYMATLFVRSMSHSVTEQHRCDLKLRNYVENSHLTRDQADILGQLVSR